MTAEAERQPGAAVAGGTSGGATADKEAREEWLPARILVFDWAQSRLLCTTPATAAGGYLKTSPGSGMDVEEPGSTQASQLSSTGRRSARARRGSTTRKRRGSSSTMGSRLPGDRSGLAATGGQGGAGGGEPGHESAQSYARLGTRGLRLCFNPQDAT